MQVSLGLFHTVKFILFTERLAADKLHAAFHMPFFIPPAYVAKPPPELEPPREVKQGFGGFFLMTADKLPYGNLHVIIDHLLVNATHVGKECIVRLHESQGILPVEQKAISVIAVC